MKLSVLYLMLAMMCIGGCVPVEPEPADNDLTDPNGQPEEPEPIGSNTLMIFHNSTGPMCIEALDWLDEMKVRYPALNVEEKLTYVQDDLTLLNQLRAEYGQSQGVSTSFAYLPIIFFREHAFSGFNDEVASAISRLLEDG